MNPFLVFVGLSAMTYLFARDALRDEITFTHNVLPLLILVTVVVFRKPITEKIKTLTEKINAKVEAMEREEQHLQKEKPTHDETPRNQRKIPPDDIVTAPLIEQEIYLLKRYSSREHFGLMRDAFKAMVNIGWAALDEFMRHPPRDYRKRPLFEQPDIVWGKRVLPNFANTDELLDLAWEQLGTGDFSALGAAHGVRNGLIAMMRDYPYNWMPEPFRTEFDAKMSLASDIEGQIIPTADGSWRCGSLCWSSWKEELKMKSRWGMFPPPPTWPIYRLNTDVRIRTGEKVKQTGIYLPESEKGSPQFMYVCDEKIWGKAPPIDVSEPGTRDADWQPTLWTSVERVADEGGPVPGQEPWREENAPPPTRVKGGQPCPRKGYWYSPANKSKPRIFKKGKIMPIVTSTDQAQNYWLWGGEIEEK